MRGHVYRTRGIVPIIAVLLILVLKHLSSIRVSSTVFLAAVMVSVMATFLREWGAGFIGSAAQSLEPKADVLITAGPYAHVRHPLYLAALLNGLAFCIMSGFWYSYLIVLAAFSFLYYQIVPYEEKYLALSFAGTYEDYRSHVPRLIPRLRGYYPRHGVFRWRNLSGEIPVVASVPFLWLLFWVF